MHRSSCPTFVFTGLLAFATVCGCSSVRSTDTARGSVEELLLSTAADRAIAQLDLSSLKGKRVYLDASNVSCVDKGYVIAALRDQLGRSGVLLVDDRKDAELIAEARVGALATDSTKDLIGIPSMPMPLMGAGAINTPELALYRKVAQSGQAKLAINARDPKTGKQTLSAGPVEGTAHYVRKTMLLTTWTQTDIPESQDEIGAKTLLVEH
jgi:uncharacterized protein DUF6655